MDFLALTQQEAQKLMEDYWAQRGFYLRELCDKAQALGYDLPTPEQGYLPKHLPTLDKFLEQALYTKPQGFGFPKVPEWLAALHDPLDDNKGFSNDHIFLGVAVSYAFADAILKTVKGAKLIACHEKKLKRYIYQNLPVLRGEWGKVGEETPDISPLEIGNGTVGLMREGGLAKCGTLRAVYEESIASSRAKGLVNENGI